MIELLPTISEMDWLKEPETTVTPFTLIEAVESIDIGVTVIELIVFGTAAE